MQCSAWNLAVGRTQRLCFDPEFCTPGPTTAELAGTRVLFSSKPTYCSKTVTPTTLNGPFTPALYRAEKKRATVANSTARIHLQWSDIAVSIAESRDGHGEKVKRAELGRLRSKCRIDIQVQWPG